MGVFDKLFRRKSPNEQSSDVDASTQRDVAGRSSAELDRSTSNSNLSNIVDTPTASDFAQPLVDPTNVADWADKYVPGVSSRGEYIDIPQPAHTYSRNIGEIPAGYELVRSDQAYQDSARLEIPDFDGSPRMLKGENFSISGDYVGEQGTGTSNPRGLYWDPFSLIEQLGYREKPSGVSFSMIDQMIWQMPIIQAIIQTRLNQISAFCTPTNHKFEYGFRIRMRDIEDQPTSADKKFMKRMTDMLLQGGVGVDPRSHDNFETFVRKIMRDSCSYDAMSYEIVPDRRGRPAAWYAIDAKTIRYANSAKLYPDTNTDNIFAVQIYDNVTIAEFTREELAYDVRNPRTDIRAYSYGVAEAEMLVRTITALLFAWDYNVNAFSQGSLQKGLLNIVGSIPEKQLRAFRRQWTNMIAGAHNCLDGSSIIWTKERGAVSLSDYVGTDNNVPVTIWTGKNWEKGLVFKTAPKKVCLTGLANGLTIKTSPEHKFRVMDDEGQLVWKTQAELVIDDYVAVNSVIPESEELIPSWRGQKIDSDLMEVLGWMTGDGSLYHTGKHHAPRNMMILYYHTHKESDVQKRHTEVLKKYGIKAQEKRKTLTDEQVEKIKKRYGFKTVDRVQLRTNVFMTEFTEWLVNLGFTVSKKKLGGKSVPPFVATLPTNLKAAFLRGLFSADGCNANKRSPVLSIVNSRLREQTKLLLLSLGIRTTLSEGKTKIRIDGPNRKRVQGASVLRIKDRDRFFSIIGFVQSHKQPRELTKINESNKYDRLPDRAVKSFLREVRKINDLSGKTLLSKRERMDLNSILTDQDGCSRPRLLRFMSKVNMFVPNWLTSYHYEPVVALSQTDIEVPMFDISVFDNQHQFVGSGIVLHNSFRTPITNAERIEWINMQSSSKDMEFGAFMDFMIKVSCACYAIDPMELNFKYGNSGSGKEMFSGASKSKITESKDRGLKPLLRFLGRSIDKHIIWPIDPNFSIEFVGLDSQTPKEMMDLMTQRVRTMFTINELRAEQDMAPLPNGLGDVILDANWMNARKEVLAKKQADQAKKEQDAELEAQTQALASAKGSKVSDEELNQLRGLLTPESGMGPPGAPPVGSSFHGPGGGRRGTAETPPPNLGKSLNAPEMPKIVIDFEV